MSIYRRKSGRWAVLIDLDRGADGARRRRALGTYATRKEAERVEREALSAHERGIDLAPRTTTLADVAARFLGDADTRLERKTVERYEDLLRLHVLPTLGSIAVGKLRPAHIGELYAKLLTEPSSRRAKLSPRTVHHVHRLLHRVLGWAERMQLVERNVVRSVDPPTPQASEAKAIEPDEVAAILAEAEGTRWHPFIVLAFATGARRGELLALTWDDVDVTRSIVTIRRALSQTRRAGIYVKATKTNRVRTVGLSPTAIASLRSIRAAQAAEKLAAGPAYQDEGFVFADALGRRLYPDVASRAFSNFAKRAGISTTKLHAARHTAATLMLGAGTDVRTVAGILGHSAASTTLNVYGHLIASRATTAVDALGDEIDQARARRAARDRGA